MTVRTRLIISLICGIISSFVTILLLHQFKYQDGIDLYSFNIFFVIPIGACICGTLALSGLSLGYVLSKTKPDRLYLIILIIFSVIVPSTIYSIDYLSALTSNGTKVFTIISFPKYLDILFSQSTYSIGSVQKMMNIGYKIGNWGYLIALLQVIGFFLGGLMLFSVVKLKYPNIDQ